MLFPKTIAEGEAFCNREAERERLHYNITTMQHTIVVSPRRYGKTSLILKVIDSMQWPYAYVDLFLAFEEAKVVERFLVGIAKLIANVIPINIKAINKIREFFKAFTISLVAGNVSVGLKIESADSSHSNTLRNAIESLEKLLIKHKKKAIFFIDEMQDIVKTPICSEVEAILRFYAQKTKNIAFIFSGSNRKLLQEIFDDRTRPLFKLCDKINLKRIDSEHYINFINKAAKKRWRKALGKEGINIILKITECHPYYVNYLCSQLWREKIMPNVEGIQQTWSQLCDEETSNVANDIASLSINQKKLLEFIAHKRVLANVTSKEVLQEVKLTSRGIQQSLKGLLDKDLIENIDDGGGVRIVDPLLKSILLRA